MVVDEPPSRAENWLSLVTMKVLRMPSGRPRIIPAAALTSAERQARRRNRSRDAIGRIENARRLIDRVDKTIRFCGDIEVVTAWAELCEILNADNQA